MAFIVTSIHLVFILFPLCMKCSKLNVPRVLLPYNHDIASNFTLKVYEGGCYKWTSSRDEVLLEEIANNGCSEQAIVYAVTRSPARLTAIILAKDIVTGFSLRCDVIVDSIDRLEIVTTTRELYAEEAPEEFEVRAYDHQGNEFSTLERQIFVWDLQTITDYKAVVPAQTVLRFITFEASPYESPPSIATLEAKGEQGYMVLIEGRQTGLARLSVRMPHPAYKGLTSTEVDLMVIANLILEPQDVYILPLTTVEYSVFHLKQGVFHPVEIEGSQYSLQVSDNTIAILEEDGIHVTGLALGKSLVMLQDNNVKSSETLKQPTATLHVVDPSYLTITIFPHNNPALIVGNHYAFVVHVYDKNNNKICLSSSIVINTVVPWEFISTEYISRNGTYVEGIPIHKGTTKITAKLSVIEVGDEVLQISPPLKASLSLDIYDRISVLPPLMVLPWDPITKPVYKVNLTVEGVAGSVTWSSSDIGLVEVNTLGQCQTKGEGIASVTAALTINPHNYDTAQIHIEEVLKLDLLEGVVEVEVEKALPLAVAMITVYEESEVFFTQCNQLPLRLEIEESSFSASEFGNADRNNSCVSVDVSSKRPGFSTVTVSYQALKGELKDATTIGAFKHLQPKFPDSGKTVLALGTSRIVVFEGGPLPWIKKPSGHYAKVNYVKSSKLSAELVKKETGSKVQADIHAVFVECHELGEVSVTLRVGNEPSSLLPFPVQVSSSLRVICALPDTIALSAATSTAQGCSPNNDQHTVVAHCYKPLPLEVSVRDSEGRMFDNISSLAIDWSVSETTIASFPNGEASMMTQVLHGFHLPLTAAQNLVPFGVPGEVLVKATVTGYKHDSVRHLALPSLQDSLRILLMKDAQLSPRELVLFNHRENQGEIIVRGGSGHFQLSKEENGIAAIEFASRNNKIIVSPLSDGNTSLILRDLCLEPTSPPSATIRISSLGSLDLLVKDRMEVSSSVEAEVVARDMFGSHVPVHTLMKLTPHPQSSIIALSSASVNKFGNAVFRVEGKNIGETMLKMSCKKGTSTVYSPLRPIQVFPTLIILPKNITLIIGAVFQVETRGGPYPDSTIEFLIENETISSVSFAGVITALSLGTARLTARAVSQHKDGQPLVVYSKNSVTINVIPLDTIRIHAPLRRIETGNTMPVYAMGVEDSRNPLSYATAIPPLLFDWSLSNKQIASFKTIYSENDVVESRENQGIVRFKALKPGRVTITLKVSVAFPHSVLDYQTVNNGVLTDKMEIKVFESLRLRKPRTEDAKILLSPNAETKIITNRESEGKILYSVEYSNDVGSPLVVVSPEGIVKSGSVPGDAVVVVTLEEPFGIFQTISILVEVRPISYIETIATPFMKAADKNFFSYLPLGVSHDLKLALHDNRGRVFTATNSAVEFRPSRFDLVNVQSGSSNNSLALTVRDMGQTVLHIWDRDNPFISDFVKVDSGPGIFPDRAAVPVGSYICFTSSLRSPTGEVGTWSSESSALELDPATGLGVTYQVGKVSVSYRLSNTVVTTTELYINPIQKISWSPPSQPLSNIKRENDFFIPVTFEGENNVRSKPLCFPHSTLQLHIPFTCILSFSSVLPRLEAKNVFSATATYLPDEGFGCLLESLFDSDVIFATSGVELLLGVSVVKSGVQEDVRTPMTTVPFYPAAVIDRSEVVLTNNDPIAVVVIHGSPELLSSFTVASDERNVDVQIEDIEGSSCHLVMSARDVMWSGTIPLDPLSLSLVSSLTRQTIQVKINFEQIGPDMRVDPSRRVGFLGLVISVLSRYQNILFSLLCLIITVVCLVFGYYSLVSPGYKQTQNIGVFAAAAAANLPPQMSPGNSSATSRGRSLSSISPSPSSSSSPEGLNRRLFSQSPQGISLWSVDREPIYGDPLLRSSPRPAYEGSATYSRTSSP